MRRRTLVLGTLFGGLLAGCGGSESSSGGGGGTAGGDTGEGGGKSGVAVGMVTDTGGRGDLSFNMMAAQGLERAEKELGVAPQIIESQQVADYVPNLQRLAEKGCKVVFAIGFALEPALKDVAPRYPDTHFVLIDAAGPKAANVTGITFREEEGSYLAGALAGGMSKSGKLGFVGGMEIPLIKKFEAGFRAGAKTTQPAADVQAKYTNNWEDVAKGKELALALFGGGADIVMHASGRCGLGVIEAAKEKGDGHWAIGVDADQDYLGTADSKDPQPPSRVLTSMMKRVDNAVFAVCDEASKGSLQGGVREFGVKEEGVGLSPLKYTKSEIPAELLAKVDRLREEIASGTLKPPKTLEELDGWVAPKV
jgi:basic membrane protein A and related proteins